ncbi:MAG: glycosyltransferase [Clostridiales bacterium]|nr:glycosyltransferase [Clostridiales bacterium]
MMKDKVSVLVTFYNQERYVDAALESILSQKTVFGVKIIVGDDGSCDGTCDAVRRWMERYPGRIDLHVADAPGKEERIPGFCASKNRIGLLKYVNTEYFIFLDGDDHFTGDDKLQRQADILDSDQNQDCIACGHNTSIVSADGTEKTTCDPSLKEGKISARKYWRDLYFHTDSILFRSSVIPKLDLDLLENSFNDNMITFSALRYGKIYYLPMNRAVYLQTGDGIWTSGRKTENLIRNMMFYDLSVKLMPSMRSISLSRFNYLWDELPRIRKEIDPGLLAGFASEAGSKKLKNAYRWIMYKDQSPLRKAAMLTGAFFTKSAAPVLRHLP